jgi:hypothetical protein
MAGRHGPATRSAGVRSRSRSARSLRRLVTSRKSDGEAQARADARASGKDGVFESLAHERGITARGGVGDGPLEVAFYAALQIHLASPSITIMIVTFK